MLDDWETLHPYLYLKPLTSPDLMLSTARLTCSWLHRVALAGALDTVSPDEWEDLENLLVWSRAAAALQPDATSTPASRCQARWLIIYTIL